MLEVKMYLTYFVRLCGIKRRNLLQGCTELNASECLLCRDVHYSGSLYFSAAPQILIFMNVPLPVFELLHSERHCTVNRNCSILTSECYVYFYTPLRLSRIHERDLSVE